MERESEFIAYMRAFEASARHLGECCACQTEQPCPVGEPIHTHFIACQDAWHFRDQRERP